MEDFDSYKHDFGEMLTEIQKLEAEAEASMSECSVIKFGRYTEAVTRFISVVDARLNHLCQTTSDLHKRITDMEAARFADSCEMEMDLQKWQDGIAAHVGHDLEKIADRLMDAIKSQERGEDVGASLFQIHGDIVDVIADLSSMSDEEDV